MPLQKFCPNCGKETKKLIKGLCENCFKKKNKLLSLPKKIEIERCPNCGKFKDKGKWTKPIELKNFLREKIKEKIQVNGKLGTLEINLNKINKKFETELKAKGVISEDQKTPKSEELKFDLEIKTKVCKYCSRKLGGYYEGILQLRGSDENIKKSLNIIEKILKENNKGMKFISNIQRKKNGIDIYLGSKGLLKKISRRLKTKFKAQKKESYSLKTQKEGKKVYTSTIFLKV